MNNDLLKEIVMKNQGEILKPYDSIIHLDGFDAVMAIAEMMGGLTVYVPSKRSIFMKCLEAEARKEFKGNNYAKLAVKYGFSERHMRRLFAAH